MCQVTNTKATDVSHNSKPPVTLTQQTIYYIIALACLLHITTAVSYSLPQAISSSLYNPAAYTYDSTTKFDNTPLTYATDYIIAAEMILLAVCILRNVKESSLKSSSISLLFLYCLSVVAGGLSHQYYTTLESLNKASFRFMWTIVVGCTTMAGAFIGMAGSSYSNLTHLTKRYHVLTIPNWFWLLYGTALTALVPYGALSMKRPAADIFIAGVTQTPPTVYLVISLWSSRHPRSKTFGVITLTIGALLNAPLLPLYPALVNAGLSLGVVNAILHSWLFVAWGMQGLGYSCAISEEEGGEEGGVKKEV